MINGSLEEFAIYFKSARLILAVGPKVYTNCRTVRVQYLFSDKHWICSD